MKKLNQPMIIFVLLCLWLCSCENHQQNTQYQSVMNTENQNKRYFRNCSCLHKMQTKPVYLYDEISEEEALKTADNQAYWVGYFKGEKLIKYEKYFRGEVFISKEIE